MITTASGVTYLSLKYKKKNNAGLNLKDNKTFNQNQRKTRMTQI